PTIRSSDLYDKTFSNGDQGSLVLISFICKEYTGNLVGSNEESLKNEFYPLNKLPENIFSEHRMLVDDLLSKKTTTDYGVVMLCLRNICGMLWMKKSGNR